MLQPAGSVPMSKWLPEVLAWRFGQHRLFTETLDVSPADLGLCVGPLEHPRECLAFFLTCSVFDGHAAGCSGQCRLFYAWALRNNAIVKETYKADLTKTLLTCSPCSVYGHPTAPPSEAHLGNIPCKTCGCSLHAVCATPAHHCPACGEKRMVELQASLAETDREIAVLQRKRKRQADDIERLCNQMKK